MTVEVLLTILLNTHSIDNFGLEERMVDVL
jgi:hypothetical protein